VIYHACEPRSADWFKLRCCIPTASEFHKIVTPTGKLSAQSAHYAHVLLAEAMLGRPLDDDMQTQWMERGNELEESAITAYEMLMGLDTQAGGFITNDAGTVGCSPDRLVGEDGILEMKVPAPNTHVGYLVTRDFGKEKYPQVQGQMLISERKWVDLMSFHPELPPVIVRVERDEKYLAVLAKGLGDFVAELQAMRESLIEKYGEFPAIQIGVVADEPQDDEYDGFGLTDEEAEAFIASRFPAA
jgi:hypothetical protein